MKETDLLIIGAGPAGCTAAIYATRSGFKPVILGGTAPGGQLLLTHEIENFPGFPEPVPGYELMDAMHKQCRRLGAEIVQEEVKTADLTSKPFTITSSSGIVYKAKAVIIATGASSRWLNIPSETRLRNKGVSACAVCDGFFYKGKDVCVIGGGDTAVGDALFLTRFVNKVTVIHRRNQLRAKAAIADYAMKDPKINFAWDSVVEEITGEDRVTGIRLKNVKTGQISELPCQGVFVAIGHEPETGFLGDQLKLDEQGYIAVQNGKTSVDGIFACGDVIDPTYKQAVIAAGSGAIAALEAEKYLHCHGGN